MIDRRFFLWSSALVAGELLVGCSLSLSHGASGGIDGEKPPAFVPNAWVRVTASGQIICILDRVEMGQGTMTTQALIVAEEFGVPMAMVRVELAPVASEYINCKLGMQLTGGSTSIASSWEPLRLAAAGARDMLIAGGAKKLGVDPRTCRCEGGKIVHVDSQRSLDLADIAAFTAKEIAVPESPQPRREFKLIGKPHGRIDERAKITGAAAFGIDTQRPGLLIAAIARPEAHGAAMISYNITAAQAFLKGLDDQARFIEVSTGVAVVTTSAWLAMEAAALIQITAGPSPVGAFAGSIAQLAQAQGHDNADASAKRVTSIGDAASSYSEAKHKLTASYEVPYLPHVTLEPQNCTAHYTGDNLTIWVPTQMPSGALVIAAKISGLSRERIKVHTTYIGGGFGRRIAQDYVHEAIELTVQLYQPVKVVWSRASDSMHDCYRPGMLHRMQGAVQHKHISSWLHRVIGPSVLTGVLRDLMMEMLPGALSAGFELDFFGSAFRFGLDQHLVVEPTSVEGAAKLPYAIANQEVSYTYMDPGVPTGFWRSVGHSHTAFAVESMIDELALLAGADPVAMRRSLLKGNSRHLAVLNQAVAMSAWDKAMAKPEHGVRAKGVALHSCFESYCAQVIQVLFVDNTLHLEHVWCAVDCGFIVNPTVVRQQVEGGILFALSAATRQQATFKDGATVQRQMYELGLIGLAEVPAIDVAFVNHLNPEVAPSGIGEIAVPPVAPALCSALARATGKRYRQLPLGLDLGRGGLTRA